MLGLPGLGQAWRNAPRLWNVPTFVGEPVLVGATLVWTGLLVRYIAHAIREPARGG